MCASPVFSLGFSEIRHKNMMTLNYLKVILVLQPALVLTAAALLVI